MPPTNDSEDDVRVLVVPNTSNPQAVSATQELSVWLAASGFEMVLESQDAHDAGLESCAVAAAELGQPGLVVALGGDGTILKAVHLLGDREAPLLGVRYGRLGFLSGATPQTMRAAIESALAGEARLERRAMLEAVVTMEGREVGRYRGLNEVVLARSGAARVVVADVAVDGVHLERLRADGIIVATATGSTAYALSAGGPVVAPGFGGLVIVPIAPHSLQSRAVLTDAAEAVDITLPDPTRAEACVSVDGDIKPCRRAIERVRVSRAERDVLLVKHDGRQFYETVSAEFLGG